MIKITQKTFVVELTPYIVLDQDGDHQYIWFASEGELMRARLDRDEISFKDDDGIPFNGNDWFLKDYSDAGIDADIRLLKAIRELHKRTFPPKTGTKRDIVAFSRVAKK